MRYKVISICLLFILTGLFGRVNAQNGGVDAVGISNKYYNSIVKILLYDSVAAKTSPDKAYLGRGSGFFVSEDGYIFTNRHVINYTYNGYCRYKTYNEADKKFDDAVDVYSPSMLTDPNVSKIVSVGRAAVIVQVYTNSKGDSSKLYHAQIIALDTANFDGAILKINTDLNGNPVTEKFHPVPIGNSDSTRQGQDLCLFGFPAQYGGDFNTMLKDLSTLIFGKNSGYDFTYNTQYGFIKTDAAINNGNSGGPVFGPSNNVIGIATAAFEKTNVGLIGGIDAMYYVSALVPDLQKQVTARGLTPPQHQPTTITATLYKPVPLPTAKDIKKANNRSDKKGYTTSKAYVILCGIYGVANNNTFSIDPYSDAEYSIKGGTYNIPSMEYGLKFRVIKPAFLKQTNHLIGYFFDLTPTAFVPNWHSNNAFSVKNGSLNMASSDPGNFELQMNLSLGLSYTYLFKNDLSISAFYGLDFDISPGVGGSANSSAVSIASISTTGTQNISYTTDFLALVQSTGILFRCKALILGMDYHFGNSTKVHYQLPDIIGGTNNLTQVNGVSKRSVLYLTLGFVF